MKKIFFLIFFTLLFASWAYAGQKSRIELTNGNTLEGEIVSFSEGQYTIRVPSLGTIKIPDSRIRAIHRGADSQPVNGVSKKDAISPDNAVLQNELQKIQPAVMGNPDIMKAIPDLISNPEFQDLLKDPEILDAAKTMDVKALMANPKFINAANSPAIKEISQKVKKQNSEGVR